MADSRLVSEWLKKAEEDFGFACSVLEDSSFYAQICFHFSSGRRKISENLYCSPRLGISKDPRSARFVKPVLQC